MRRRALLGLALTVVIGAVAVMWGAAQDAIGVVVTFPQPGNILQGTVGIRGTVVIPDENGFRVEYRRLGADLQPINGPDGPWSPASIPNEGTLVDGIIGFWNTALVDDGFYEMRVVVEQRDSDPVRIVVRPVQVANTSGIVVTNTPAPMTDTPTPTVTMMPVELDAAGLPIEPAVIFTEPSLFDTPIATRAPEDRQVFLTGLVEANIRLGDSVAYPSLEVLRRGERIEALAVSTRSTWYQVALEDNIYDFGWIASSVVEVEGEPSFLPRVTPPILPFTATPEDFTPSPTPSPIPIGNLVWTDFRTEPADLTCAQTYTIFATVQNFSAVFPTNATALITVEDILIETGQTAETTIGAVIEALRASGAVERVH
ncbi:MAG: hypothetical protein AAF125_03945, partial [Chloroflexota bacterium]